MSDGVLMAQTVIKQTCSPHCGCHIQYKDLAMAHLLPHPSMKDATESQQAIAMPIFSSSPNHMTDPTLVLYD